MKNKKAALAGALILSVALLMAVLVACGPEEKPVPRTQCEVYIEQGCDKLVVASNGQLDIQSGATFMVSATLEVSNTLDMNNNPITNIGVAGTDFGTDGSLTTAARISVTGGITISSGGITVTSGNLDMTGGVIRDVGATGTDFGSDGSLTLAQGLTVSASGITATGGITVMSGGISIAAGSLVLEDVAFSGPVTFGSDTTTTEGELIAHGLGTTPAAVLITVITDTLVNQALYSVAVSNTNTVSFTVSITPAAASGNIGIYWMAGR